MPKKMPDEFWEWARANGYIPRGPRGSMQERMWQSRVDELKARWWNEHKEAE